jgi:4-hydroxy 2-oxovalerate aldolase
MKKVTISDCSLRDGNHFVKHQISIDSIKRYCKFADEAGIPIVEVGHGNGLGASSILIGEMPHTDMKMLYEARQCLKNSKLGIHIIPGLATKDDISMAMELGVDIFRVACHCTEATVTKSHIDFLKSRNHTVYGVLMMSALIDTKELTKQAKILESYGADAVVIMDSTGTYFPKDVAERMDSFGCNLNCEYGFHAHNNLGFAIQNSITAYENGASIIDACICGFGAGAGNAQLEVLVTVFEKMGISTGIDFTKLIVESDKVKEYLVPSVPTINGINILTGLNKLFSGFEKPIIKAANIYGVEYSSLIFELGKRKLVAGQEDLIIETANRLKNESSSNRS